MERLRAFHDFARLEVGCLRISSCFREPVSGRYDPAVYWSGLRNLLSCCRKMEKSTHMGRLRSRGVTDARELVGDGIAI